MESTATAASGKPDPGVRRLSRAEEKRLALSLSPAVAWPTLALAIILPSAFIAVAAQGILGRWPLWACSPVLAFVSYAHYTLVHEAIHGNVVAKPRNLAWVNTLVGWVGALGLGIGWPLLQRGHVLHHAHTNTEEDPDLHVKGSLLQLIAGWPQRALVGLVPPILAKPIAPARYRKLYAALSVSELAQSSVVSLFTLGLLAAAVVTGRVEEWLLLWFAPISVASLLLGIFFQWLPHHPFDRFDRYGNTRVSLWPGGELLTFHQNLHLVHHLWPSVPFYNYGRLFRGLAPVLIAEGSPIQGFCAGRLARCKAAAVAATATAAATHDS